MPRYPTVLLDLDHTLFDSDESERQAFHRALAAQGVADPERHLETYVRINTALWAAVERGVRSAIEVRLCRFAELVEVCALDADPHRLADAFVLGLGACGELYPGAVDALDELAGTATLALVTNGLGEVQRARLERLGLADRFAAVVISGEVGVAKPAGAFFDLAFAQLGDPDRTGTLMVGDSLSADIAGGAACGTSTCWYNPHGRDAGVHLVDHVIARLDELPVVVRG
jgi:2-haloacid dehalogenase